MSQKDYHNRSGLTALMGSIIFVTVFFFYVVYINKGVDLAENVTEPAKPGEVQFDLASVKEPWADNEQVLAAGAKIYKANCAVCHGAKGDLVGGIPTARNLVEGNWKMGAGKIAHYKVLQDGVAGTQMVSFKASLKTYERWALVLFIDSITQNKPANEKPEDVAAFATTAD